MPLVVNDPGHGTRDSGAPGNGFLEKDYNLAVCHKFTDALKRCGFQVIMTRETDTLPLGQSADISADLSHRAKIANDAHADLYVSWHADSSNDPSVSGLAVWIHPNARGTRTETRAHLIGETIATATGQKFRGVNAGDFAVLRETTMDAVLIEGDFITNADAAKKLFDPSFQTTQAEAAARALCEIFGVTYVPSASSSPYSLKDADKEYIIERWIQHEYDQATDADKEKRHEVAEELRKNARGSYELPVWVKDYIIDRWIRHEYELASDADKIKRHYMANELRKAAGVPIQ